MESSLAEFETILTGHWLTDLSNTCAFLFLNLPRINWVGFYLYDGRSLVLGPFQGKPACTTIAVGRGVCGTAFQKKGSLIVDDVEKFPGHIVCDPASKSELVVPLLRGQECLGVLDIDSADPSRFQSKEQIYSEKIVELLMKQLKIPPGALG